MKTNNRKAQHGFTLIELAIVMGVVALLAIVALPNWRSMSARAKASEATQLLTAMASGEEQLLQSQKSSVPSPVNGDPITLAGYFAPAQALTYGTPGPNKTEWTNDERLSFLTAFGFLPSSGTYGQYSVATAGAGAYALKAAMDLDGDGTSQVWVLLHPALAADGSQTSPNTTAIGVSIASGSECCIDANCTAVKYDVPCRVTSEAVQ